MVLAKIIVVRVKAKDKNLGKDVAGFDKGLVMEIIVLSQVDRPS